ncbi:mast cell protease 8-like [Morone saxatilis]|uniref:mast cell protease 8-like n=1 Tax=Morone saxatilis TaxID=34816 RepID=UPI0015E1EABB|nr:mast cell protease 8-like [Morone saxatilis]
MQYMASLQNNGGHFCGGFLISKDFLLTAAHCDSPTLSHVVLGTHNLKKADKTERNIAMKCKHPSYQNVETGNDLMLLKLSSEVHLSQTVKVIPLPSSDMNIQENEMCHVAGWGSTRTDRVVDDLRMVDVSIINWNVCKKEWPKLSDNAICAGGYGTTKGFCQGDSGGPLVCRGVAVGVVSYNKYANCNYPDAPNVYVDISKFLPWINKVLKEKNC